MVIYNFKFGSAFNVNNHLFFVHRVTLIIPMVETVCFLVTSSPQKTETTMSMTLITVQQFSLVKMISLLCLCYA